MAIYGGSWIYKDVKIVLWLDPNQYRVTILKKSDKFPDIWSRPIKRMVGKDKRILLKRAQLWIDDRAQYF